MNIYKQRLLEAADLIEGVDSLDMRFVRHRCGTPACAWGWLQHYKILPEHTYTTDYPYKYYGFDDLDEFHSVFGSGLGEASENGFYEKSICTGKQWADCCRKFVAEKYPDEIPEPVRAIFQEVRHEQTAIA